MKTAASAATITAPLTTVTNARRGEREPRTPVFFVMLVPFF
jgi:hypothetical protein